MKKIFMALMLSLVSICIYSDSMRSEWVNIGGQKVEVTYYNGDVYSVFYTDGNTTIYLTDENAKNFVNNARKREYTNFYKGINVNYRVVPVDTNVVYRSFYALDNNIINENDSVEKIDTNGKVRFLYNQFYYTPILRKHNENKYWYFIVHNY